MKRMEQGLRKLLDAVAEGSVAPADALDRLRDLPFADLGFARVDHHRGLRCGFPEVVFCPGKELGNCVTMRLKRVRKTG